MSLGKNRCSGVRREDGALEEVGIAVAVVGGISGKQRYCCGSGEIEGKLLLGRHCCGSGEMEERILREQSLLWQGGNTEKAPAGADTTAAVWKYREGSCGSRHYCGSVEIQRKLVLGGHCCGSGKIEKRFLWERALLQQCGDTEKLLLEWTLLRQCGNKKKASAMTVGKQKRLLQKQMLLRQCGNVEKAPVRGDTAAAVWKYREGSCGSRHYCGSVEIQRKLVLGGHCCGSEEVEKRLLWEQSLLRQGGNTEKAPAGADTTAAVWKYRESLCWVGTAAAVGK
ncbi:hypothetical protein ROHU_000745 [Labeo rohita]|uniref:Uncharacterized protein n=1 Tax=Labeo rohita TaxID=84645 RepID=A0A498P4J0_LABRO|nr:hypothetical protein ROHU_008144 [Labeo rohita]RXN38836.1 hypothetical protein ROHU_000745 [Labeo rohita]